MTVGLRSWRGRLRPRAAAIVGVVLGALAMVPTAAESASGQPTGANCQPYAAAPCLFPFPDDRLAIPDRKAVTGLRVQLPQAAMPRNTAGAQINALAVRRRRRVQSRLGDGPARARPRQRRGNVEDRRGRSAEPERRARQTGADRRDRSGNRPSAADLVRARRERHQSGDHRPRDPPRQELHRGSHLHRRVAQPANRQRRRHPIAEMVRAAAVRPRLGTAAGATVALRGDLPSLRRARSRSTQPVRSVELHGRLDASETGRMLAIRDAAFARSATRTFRT